MLRGSSAARFAVRLFGCSEYTFGKARRARDRFAHAAYLDKVDSD